VKWCGVAWRGMVWRAYVLQNDSTAMGNACLTQTKGQQAAKKKKGFNWTIHKKRTLRRSNCRCQAEGVWS